MGTLKLTKFKPRDFPDLVDTATSNAAPKPAGDLQMMTLDEIQNDDAIEVLRNATIKEIWFKGKRLPSKVTIAAPVTGLKFWTAESTAKDWKDNEAEDELC
jgi:hypothetical protein